MFWLAIVIITTVGIYPTLCLVLGAARVLDQQYMRIRSTYRGLHRHRRAPDRHWVGRHWALPASLVRGSVPSATSVAVLVAAHNEELVIEKTIASARSQVPLSNIYVVSDGSTDTTVQKARAAGASVIELTPNRGKGGAIAAGLEHFKLCEKYELVLLLDADTVLSPEYLKTGLPLFSDSSVAVVSGTAKTIWHPQDLSPVGQLLIAYRERIYYWGQKFLKYGQAWHRANAVLVVPGFASMYRTSVLQQIDITAPGLVVEDLNMTFEVHRKRLGKIAYHPYAAIAYTQDPNTIADYIRQVKRWALVLWQTVRRQGFLHTGFFWVSLVVCIAELIPYCLILILSPVLITLYLIYELSGLRAPTGGMLGWLLAHYNPGILLVVVVLPEILVATIVAISLRRPRYLLYALGFPVLRILDAALVLYTLPLTWITRSTGTWTSPVRRAASKMVSVSDMAR